MKLHQIVYKILSTAMIISATLLATGIILETLGITLGKQVIETGVLALMATPYMTIIVLIIVAVKRKDKPLLLLSTTILLILLTSLTLGLIFKLKH